MRACVCVHPNTGFFRPSIIPPRVPPRRPSPITAAAAAAASHFLMASLVRDPTHRRTAPSRSPPRAVAIDGVGFRDPVVVNRVRPVLHYPSAPHSDRRPVSRSFHGPARAGFLTVRPVVHPNRRTCRP